jgi:CheY-like chemotaxis protein
MEKSVLIVDDNQIDTLINERILASLGLVKQFHKASNGEEALQIVNEYKNATQVVPDIILLDLNMPVMDGFQFIQAFQALEFPQKEKILIVIVTSSSSREDIDRIKKLGIKHYLTKPLTQEGVKSILHEEFRLDQ